MGAAVRPAVLLPGTDQVARVVWVDGDPRFHLGVEIVLGASLLVEGKTAVLAVDA